MTCLQLNDNPGSMPWERAECFAGLPAWQHGINLGHFVKVWRFQALGPGERRGVCS